MLIREASIFRSPFATPSIYRDPFDPSAAWEWVHPHWLWSPLGQRHFIELVRHRLPSPFWPRQVVQTVVDAVADVLVADLRARRRKGGGS